MHARRFHPTGSDISLLGFGLMRLPLAKEGKSDINEALATSLVDRAIAAGVNYFDTAWPYHEGLSEPFAGRALSRHPRETWHLASKMPTWEIRSPDDVERIFAEQLKRCRVEYFDFYLAHNLNRESCKAADAHGMYRILQRKKEEGLIRALGFSFHDEPALLERLVTEEPWDFAQIQLNYIDWEATDAKQQYAVLASRGIPVVIMEPVRGGALASLNPEATGMLKKAAPEASTASWALRFAASLPGVLTVLSGMNAPEQLEDNIRTMSDFKPLTDEERTVIAGAAASYLTSGAVPCTGCRYCMDCPAGVDIPRVFAIYNHYRTQEGLPNARVMFDALYRSLSESAQAKHCVACGECLEHCPQGIAVPEFMEKIAAFAAGPSL